MSADHVSQLSAPPLVVIFALAVASLRISFIPALAESFHPLSHTDVPVKRWQGDVPWDAMRRTLKL